MIKSRLRRLERAAEDVYTLVRCSQCGLEVRAPGDLALKVIAEAWAEEAGQHREPDRAVDAVLSHPHAGIRDVLFSEFYGVGHA